MYKLMPLAHGTAITLHFNMQCCMAFGQLNGLTRKCLDACCASGLPENVIKLVFRQTTPPKEDTHTHTGTHNPHTHKTSFLSVFFNKAPKRKHTHTHTQSTPIFQVPARSLLLGLLRSACLRASFAFEARWPSSPASPG